MNINSTHACIILVPILFLNSPSPLFCSWKRRHPQQWGLKASGFKLGKFEAKDIKLIKMMLWFEALNIIPSLKLHLMWHLMTIEVEYSSCVMGSHPLEPLATFSKPESITSCGYCPAIPLWVNCHHVITHLRSINHISLRFQSSKWVIKKIQKKLIKKNYWYKCYDLWTKGR